MPKHLAKGSVALALDQRYSNSADALPTLTRLRTNVPLTDVGTFDNVPGKTPAERAALKTHFNVDWLGTDDYLSPGKQTTGWWHNWKGDPDAVLREALIRAIEVSIGLNHGAVPPPPPPYNPPRTQPLPVEFYWVCGLPKFEAYVCWNSQQVNVIMLTPGFSHHDPVVQALIQIKDFPDDSAHPNLPAKVLGNQGILFIGQNIVDPKAKIATMQSGVVINNLDLSRGGIGAPL